MFGLGKGHNSDDCFGKLFEAAGLAELEPLSSRSFGLELVLALFGGSAEDFDIRLGSGLKRMGLDSFELISFHFERQHLLWQETPQDSTFDLEADS